MVSPPLPMTRPTLLAGIRICWMELLPSMSLWKPGPYRHCSTISLSSLFACLWSEAKTGKSIYTKPSRVTVFCVRCEMWAHVIQGAMRRICEFTSSVTTTGHLLLIMQFQQICACWDLLNVFWAPSQCAGSVQHASAVYNKQAKILINITSCATTIFFISKQSTGKGAGHQQMREFRS